MYRYIVVLLMAIASLSANISKSMVDFEIKLERIQQSSIHYIDLKTALEEVKKSHKIIMIKATSKHCHYCKKMDMEVLNSPDIANLIDEDFIAVSIDIGSEELPFGLECSMTPTFFFVDEEQNVFKTIPGSWNVEDFLSILKMVKKAK